MGVEITFGAEGREGRKGEGKGEGERKGKGVGEGYRIRMRRGRGRKAGARKTSLQPAQE